VSIQPHSQPPRVVKKPHFPARTHLGVSFYDTCLISIHSRRRRPPAEPLPHADAGIARPLGRRRTSFTVCSSVDSSITRLVCLVLSESYGQRRVPRGTVGRSISARRVPPPDPADRSGRIIISLEPGNVNINPITLRWASGIFSKDSTHPPLTPGPSNGNMVAVNERRHFHGGHHP
jgi:hypothetical protein